MKHLFLAVKMIGHRGLKYKKSECNDDTVSWGHDIANPRFVKKRVGADGPKIQEYIILTS